MRNPITANCRLAVALLALTCIWLLASCGGGAGIALPEQSNAPAPGTADLNGKLVEGGDRAVSTAGDGLAGVLVSLINSASGQLEGSDTTDVQGRFEFKGVPSGDGFLVKVEFESARDLDNDGVPDDVELLFPITLDDQTVATLVQQIGIGDSDGDSKPDCVDVDSQFADSAGRSERKHMRHRHRSDETVNDTNNDGRFDGDDKRFRDEDHDGLPDDNPRLGSVMARGQIEALSDTSITVATVEFAITDATRWHVHGSGNRATAADFEAGMWVKVHGFTTEDGGLVAHKVMAHGAHDPGDDNGAGNDPDNNGEHPGNDDGQDKDDRPGDADNDGQPDDPGDDPNGGDDPSGGDPDNDPDNGDEPPTGGDDDPNSGDDPSGGDGNNDPGDGDDPNGGDDDNSGGDGNGGDSGGDGTPPGGGDDPDGGDDPAGGDDPNVP